MTPEHRSLKIPTCYWWRDHEAGEWIIIPGCQARVHDPTWCTCTIPESKLERERAKRRASDDTVDRLREELSLARDQANQMRLSNRHWWKVLRDHGINPSDHNPSSHTGATT